VTKHVGELITREEYIIECMESNVRRVHEIGFTQQDSCETWANSRNEIDFKHKK